MRAAFGNARAQRRIRGDAEIPIQERAGFARARRIRALERIFQLGRHRAQVRLVGRKRAGERIDFRLVVQRAVNGIDRFSREFAGDFLQGRAVFGLHGHADFHFAPEKARHEHNGEHRSHNDVAPPDGLRRVVALDRVNRNENFAQLLHGKRAQPNEVRHAEKRARAQRRANSEANGH